MRRDQPGWRSGAPPRARGRGGVPPLSPARTPTRPLLGHRRCRRHAGAQPLCPPLRSRQRPRRRRQMERCRDRRARRSARPDRPPPDLPRLADAIGEARAFLALPRPDTPMLCPGARRAPSGSTGSGAAACSLLGRPVPGTPAEAYLRARWHHRPARLAGPALSPLGLVPRERSASARSLAGAAGRGHRPRRHHHRHPAQLARPHRHGKGAARRSAPRPRPSARQRRPLRQRVRPALRRRGSPPAKASKRCWRSTRCCRRCR